MFQNNIPEPTAACLKTRRMRKGSLVIELPSILEADKPLFSELEMLSPFVKKLYQELCQSVGYEEKLGKLDFVYDPIALEDDLLSKGWTVVSESPMKKDSSMLIGASATKKTSSSEITEVDKERVEKVIKELLSKKSSSKKKSRRSKCLIN